MDSLYSRRGLRGLLAASPLGAVAAVLIYAAAGHLKSGTTFWSVLAVGVAEVGATLVAGVLLGFLFGLPKTIDRPPVGADTRATKRARLATNTNLDQISDWLTKILVGLGLVQLGKLTHGASQIGESLAPGLGGGPGAKSLAVALLAYSVVDGFLIGYIWTRIDLSRRFRRAAEDLDPFEAEVAEALKTPQPQPPQPPSPPAMT
jgi:hypothetical protein